MSIESGKSVHPHDSTTIDQQLGPSSAPQDGTAASLLFCGLVDMNSVVLCHVTLQSVGVDGWRSTPDTARVGSRLRRDSQRDPGLHWTRARCPPSEPFHSSCSCRDVFSSSVELPFLSRSLSEVCCWMGLSDPNAPRPAI